MVLYGVVIPSQCQGPPLGASRGHSQCCSGLTENMRQRFVISLDAEVSAMTVLVKFLNDGESFFDSAFVKVREANPTGFSSPSAVRCESTAQGTHHMSAHEWQAIIEMGETSA